MRNTLIGLWGTANVGKSTTLKKLSEEIEGNEIILNNYNGHQIVVVYRGKKVGVQTYGDDQKSVEDGLKVFHSHGCNIIAIASKSYGGTVVEIERFSSQNKWRLLWTSPIQGEVSDYEDLKKYGSKILLKMIDDLIDNKL